MKEFNCCCWENISLFYVFVQVSRSLVLSLQLFFISPFLPFLSTASLLCLLCIISPISPPVLWPLAAPPYHPLLNENAANSFANNQCRGYTKERTKLFYCSPESFWMKQLLERRLELGQDVKKGGERESKRESEGEWISEEAKEAGEPSEALLTSCIYFPWIKWSWGSD